MSHKKRPYPVKAVFPKKETYPAFPFLEYWDFGQAPELEATVESPLLQEAVVVAADLERRERRRN